MVPSAPSQVSDQPFVERFTAAARAALSDFVRDRPRAVAAALGAFSVAAMIAVVMAPWLAQRTTLGFHDWDAQTSHRYLTVISLLRHHELPGWDPYTCGDFTA